MPALAPPPSSMTHSFVQRRAPPCAKRIALLAWSAVSRESGRAFQTFRPHRQTRCHAEDMKGWRTTKAGPRPVLRVLPPPHGETRVMSAAIPP